MSYPTRRDVRIMVGLDFGTTYSGFAYAHKSTVDDVSIHHEWPRFMEASGRPYCKTKTALYYKPAGDGQWVPDSWGWQAQLNYTRDLEKAQQNENHTVGELVTRFKLHLADKDAGPLSAASLPQGLTVQRVVTDYLREIGKFIMDHLQYKYGAHLSMAEIQWCVTVPSIWGDKAKQQMKSFMEGAGLVKGARGSPHPVVVVLEPEAAAIYCLKKFNNNQENVDFTITQGDRFLVADIGGGTSDIVVQEKVNSSGNLQVEEVTASTGGLCGGSYVDKAFLTFLASKIGGLEQFLREHPSFEIQLQMWWENIKSTFEGNDPDQVLQLELSRKLSDAWEKHDTERRHRDHGGVEITHDDMVHIFSGVVVDNIALIDAQLAQIPDIKYIMVVGGFAASKYLMAKIKDAFEPRTIVLSPKDPGRAICDGAVTAGFCPDNLLARISRKTYGIQVCSNFETGVDPESSAEYLDGVKKCVTKFSVFVELGTKVEMDYSVEEFFWPATKDAAVLGIKVHSSLLPSPTYTTDSGVTLEGNFDVDISSSLKMATADRAIRVSMFFGHSSIEVKAQPSHLIGSGTGTSMLPVKFDWA